MSKFLVLLFTTAVPLNLFASPSDQETTALEGPMIRVGNILGCGSDFKFSQFVQHSEGWKSQDGRPAVLFYPTRAEYTTEGGRRVKERLTVNEVSPVGKVKTDPSYYGFPFLGLTCKGNQSDKASDLKARKMAISVIAPIDALTSGVLTNRDVAVPMVAGEGEDSAISQMLKLDALVLTRKPNGSSFSVRIEESGADWSYYESFE